MLSDHQDGGTGKTDAGNDSSHAPQSEKQACSDSPTGKLRAFLHSGRYRAPDDLDDYCDDMSTFVSLNGIETADLRHRREVLLSGENLSSRPESTGTKHPENTTAPATLPPVGAACVDTHTHETKSVTLFADRCAHRFAHRLGCRRCVDSCAWGAIIEDDPVPQIDYSACSRCAACVAACPSGALQWRSSPTAELLQHLKNRLQPLADQNPAPMVVFHDRETGLPREIARPETDTIGLEVEIIGFIGAETLLTALALGAAAALVLVDADTGNATREVLAEQVRWAGAGLAAAGGSDGRIGLLDTAEGCTRLPNVPALSDADNWVPASYDFDYPKPVLIHLAAAHMARWGSRPATVVPLSDGAPVGAVQINGSKCTLCMACAGACKMKALVPIDGDRPGLQFTEADCVQCGLCAQACPEQALRLVPRLNPEPEAASPTVLHQVEPARCISCGRPFASGKMIAAILHRLKGHWMYSDPEEQRRLSMCDRCRVQDFFTKQSRGGPK